MARPIVAHALAAPAVGAVLIDEGTGIPLPVEPGRFTDAADAQAFVAWHGDCGNVHHLRDAARRWKQVRTWSACPTSGCTGRVVPGAHLCTSCECDEAFVSGQALQPAEDEAVGGLS